MSCFLLARSPRAVSESYKNELAGRGGVGRGEEQNDGWLADLYHYVILCGPS